MFSFLWDHSGVCRNGFYRRTCLKLWLSILAATLLFAAALVGGCYDSGSAKKTTPAWLVRAGETEISVEEFERTLEMAMTAYPYDIVKKPRALRQAQKQVLLELAERAVLAERARELSIQVTPDELSNAIARIKKDYPDGAFEQALLESAISFEAWKTAMACRLLMEKVTARELGGQLEVADKEIGAYYQTHLAKDGKAPNIKDLHPDIRNAIIRRLKAEKIETAYGEWLEHLKKNYSLEINKEQWQRLQPSSLVLNTGDRAGKQSAQEKKTNE